MERGTGKGSVGQVDCTGVKESVRNGRGHGAQSGRMHWAHMAT